MKQRCCILGCENSSEGRGLCHKHLSYFRRHGKLDQFPKRQNILDWLKERRDCPDGDQCLIWPFARYNKGYGNVTFLDAAGVKHSTGAHRMMCRLAHGEPPTPKHEVAHSCGNGFGGCVNPHHLRWDTWTGNYADKIKHGTDQYGERNPRSKLTRAIARDIRRSRESVTVLAQRYGVSNTI
jgi:hypothetical protein